MFTCNFEQEESWIAQPIVDPNIFNGVILVSSEYIGGDAAWAVSYFEGKSSVIRIVRIGASEPTPQPIISNITLRPAPTMTFLNPRPAPGISDYPWSYNADPNSHIIKLPLPLTYAELMEGAQIVVSGVTESLAVIEGTTEGNLLIFRAGGLLVAYVSNYEGTSDSVKLQIREDFAGEVLAVNFNNAFKNIRWNYGLDVDTNNILCYLHDNNEVAKCTLNGVVITRNTNYIPSNGLLGNLVFQSRYVQNYGNVVEAYYWTNGRYLYVLRVGEEYKMEAISIVNTNSPLQFPLF